MEQNRKQEEDTFSILIASDCHLGYKEKDPIRGHDSLVTFEEVFEIAKEHEVDFVLLGGDLFHENKPSRATLHGCIEILRKYCLGDKPCQVEFLSDQSVNFWSSSFPVINYEDPNYNISTPVFTIHGNHDDPSGSKNLSAIDLLSSSGLVNYFGKTSSVDEISISPLLMQKGKSKLAVYGLGSVRDERLHRLFASEKITMLKPKMDTDNWFNIMVVHQNRVKHGEKNYIPEEFLSDFLDLVIWGHEHESLITPEWNPKTNFFVCQPGSTVATSLTEGEAKRKHVAILKVFNKTFKVEEIPLNTVRPFYIDELCLQETGISCDERHEQEIVSYVKNKIESMISKAEAEHSGSTRQPTEPLIRLKVDYSGGYIPFNSLRFGQQFVGRVANPKDIVHFYKKRTRREITDDEEMESIENAELPISILERTVKIENIITELLANDSSYQMKFLSEKAIGDAVRIFVDKEENDIIEELVHHSLKKMQNLLKKNQGSTDLQLDQQVEIYKETVFGNEDMRKAIEGAQIKRRHRGDYDDEKDFSDSDEDIVKPSTSANPENNGRGNRSRDRARGQTRGHRNSRTPSRGRGRGTAITSSGCVFTRKPTTATASSTLKSKKSEVINLVDEDDSDDPFEIDRSKRSRKA